MSSRAKPFVFHVGISKSGTTSLQQNILAKHGGILCCGRPNHGRDAYREFRHAICVEDRASRAQPMIDKFIASQLAVAEETGLRPVLSDETLCNAPFTSVVASRLAKAASTATVLITIRSQFSSIVSHYVSHGYKTKYLPRPHNGRYTAFGDWLDHQFASDFSVIRRLDYHEIYRIFADAFGDANVTVLAYEDLAADPVGFAEQLAAVFGVDPEETKALAMAPARKTAAKARRLTYARLRSRLGLSRSVLPHGRIADSLRLAVDRLLDHGRARTITLTNEQRARLVQRFADGNRALAEYCGLDLASRGYPV